jgi:hypothetical protein
VRAHIERTVLRLVVPEVVEDLIDVAVTKIDAADPRTTPMISMSVRVSGRLPAPIRAPTGSRSPK